MAPSDKPEVFILDLDARLLDLTHSNSKLTDSLFDKYEIQSDRDPELALLYLADPTNRPVAILVIDPVVTEPMNWAILSLLKRYVHSGGMVIFACNFSKLATVDVMDNFWKDHWDYNWWNGDYHRVQVHLNKDAPVLLALDLQYEYSQEARFLKGVSLADSLYVPPAASMSQSSGVPLAPVNQHQTPVALTKVGDGWLGYIGDVNNEMGSQDAIHAMIELGVNSAILL